MNKATDVDATTWRSRFKRTIAGLVLAGALLGGASVAADDGPTAEDTTEQAFNYGSMSSWGISWR